MVDVPSRMKARPVDPRGYPIPWFVNIADDGTADFRVIRPNGVLQAHRTATCWLCGDRLGRFKTFAIGPMCAVNRITSEPGSHLDCARYAAQACPFLSQPKMKRSPRALPADATTEQPGFHLDRNPGAICLWTCTSARTVRADRGGRGVLFQLGDPSSVEWWAHGRAATRDEIEASIAGGLPFLRQVCDEEPTPSLVRAAHRGLDEALAAFVPLLPEARA
jgi:hypothetical protein